MSCSLLEQYLENRQGLELIQAISLWGSQKLKLKYLSLSSEVQVVDFIETLYNIEVLSRSTKKDKNKLRIYYSLNYPYGNAFRVSFQEVDQLCSNFVIS